MVLRKTDFTDLTVFELLQNIWECADDLENNPIYKDKQWLKDYLRWNIEHLYDKWQPELSDIKIVLQGVKEQNETFYPGATCDKKNYMDFLLSCKNEIDNSNNMQKRAVHCCFFLVSF